LPDLATLVTSDHKLVAAADDAAARLVERRQESSIPQSILNEGIRDGAELRALWSAMRAETFARGEALLKAVDARPESFDMLALRWGRRTPPP
jgi:hypothetical protein